MDPARRRFLITTPLAAAAVAGGGARVARADPEEEPSPKGGRGSLQDWKAVRELFELDPDYAHLGLFFLASHPRPVRDAIAEYRRKLDANPLLTVERSMFDFEHPEANLARRVTEAVGRYIGGAADDIALTGNTTTGLGIIYHGLPLQPGDEVLTTEHDHIVHHEAIRLATSRCGATWRKIALFDDPSRIDSGEVVARIQRAIRPDTKVLGVTWVHSGSGVKLPIRRIADLVASVNAKRDPKAQLRLIVDGVHGIGVEAPNVPALGCDAFAAGLHKWIFGPRGTGFVWARSDVWATMRPLFASFTAPDLITAFLTGKPAPERPRAAWFSPGGFHAYEHYWATPAAIALHEQIGPARVTERIHALNTLAKDGLRKISNVVLHTPRDPDLSAGMVCFDVKGKKPEEVVHLLLGKKIIASTTPYRVSTARLAFGLPNTEEEVDRALKAIRAIAG